MINFNGFQVFRGALTFRTRFLPSFLIVLLTSACAHGTQNSHIWDSNGHPQGLQKMTESLLTQKVIVLGESHGQKNHQQQQLTVLRALRAAGLQVHVGMEFFSYPYQNYVNHYRSGHLPELELLRLTNWGSISFDFYRDQVLFPEQSQGERTWALNAPRSLTGLVSQVGIEGLSDEQKSLLPPNFELGRESYRKRFNEAMGGAGHLPNPEVSDRYFAAQSIWDDTMAWQIQRILNTHPKAVVVVIVGEFHVQYGGGLPDRLRSRGVHQVSTISQVDLSGLQPAEIEKEVAPHAEYGPRADWIWGTVTVD